MFSGIKNKISKFLATRKYLKKGDDKLNFSGFFKESSSFLLLMPNEEKDFKFSLKIIDFLNHNEKQQTVLVPVKYYSLVTTNKTTKVIKYSEDEVSKLNLPKDFLANKLNRRQFDIVLDLERDENLLYSSLTNLTVSKYKVGFEKNKLNEFYNVLISNYENKAEFCYDELIDSLKMF